MMAKRKLFSNDETEGYDKYNQLFILVLRALMDPSCSDRSINGIFTHLRLLNDSTDTDRLDLIFVLARAEFPGYIARTGELPRRFAITSQGQEYLTTFGDELSEE